MTVDDLKERTYPFKIICIRVVLVWGLCLCALLRVCAELMLLWPMWCDDEWSLTDEFAIASEITAINRLAVMQKDSLLCSDIAVPKVGLFRGLLSMCCERHNHSCINVTGSSFIVTVFSLHLCPGVHTPDSMTDTNERGPKNFQPIRMISVS